MFKMTLDHVLHYAFAECLFMNYQAKSNDAIFPNNSDFLQVIWMKLPQHLASVHIHINTTYRKL